MNKFLFRLKANWSACCSALMNLWGNRTNHAVRFSKKTNLAIERCEPRLALDASQVPGDQPIDEGFFEVIQSVPTFTLSSHADGRLLVQDGFTNGAVANHEVTLVEGTTISQTSSAVGRPGSDAYKLNMDSSSEIDLLTTQARVRIVRDLSDSVYAISLFTEALPITLSCADMAGEIPRFGSSRGMTEDFRSGVFSIVIDMGFSNISGQGSLTISGQGSLAIPWFEPMEPSSVREKQPASFKKGSSLTTSLSQHRQADPAILHVSSLQTVPFESARPVFRADQAFAVVASNDDTQLVKSQSETLRGEPSYAGFLDVQATVAEIDSAQKTRVNELVFDHENGSPLFEENGLHGNTNLMPVMARATLFEVAEHRVPSLPREVLGGHDGHEKNTDGGKTVAIPTLPHDPLVASGDADDWASRDLSLYVRLSLAAAFATTTFEIDKRYRSTGSSATIVNDTNAKQKRVLR